MSIKKYLKDYNEYMLCELKKNLTEKEIYDKLRADISYIIKRKGKFKLNNHNIEYWTVRGWSENEASIKIQEIKNKRKKPKTHWLKKEYWIEKGLSQEEAKAKISEFQRRMSARMIAKKKINPEKYKRDSPFGKEFWIKKGYSEEESIFNAKANKKWHIEYWIKRGSTIEEAKLAVSEFQRSNSKLHTDKKYTDPKRFYAGCVRRKEYWIKQGLTEEEAIKRVGELQSRGLIYLKKKYGEDDGISRWKERNKKWKAKVFNLTTYIGKGTSKIADDFFSSLNIPECNLDKKFIWDETYNRAYKYDLQFNKKIIEFNGTFWHCDPRFFNKDFKHPIKNMTAECIWKYDKIKTDLAKKHGYSVLTIWEYDVLNNKDDITRQCLKFLKDEN